MSLPPTRWELAGDRNRGYGETFAQRVAEGADVDGEARLLDAIAPRGARVLDVGSGMGRVAAALQARGHRVTATEPDAVLRAQSEATYPELAVLPHEALALDPAEVGEFDVVAVVGNVMVYVGEDTERRVLARVRELLAPEGRAVVGFHLTAVKAGSRTYPPDEFVADASAAGLRVVHRFGSYELHEANDEYAVWVLARD
ncbi:methyltransferase domain-containing protein [Nocardioides KLBMP 9356]|uniref:Methyltransferase domain-containing protein n=1 Tax=Nocardioides potassii TaxID=2911371 RepID=A0ABS9HFH2_9ACTN|nr:methyltransferase domain-containing protein [Nocardioides potassii]MCF6378980.1 methyltransferase domain-containing protein [Nocardioides potassii]